MTPAQARVYELILKLSRRSRITPSYEEIAHKLKLRSIATVHKHVQALIRDGHLTRTPGRSRNLVCVSAPFKNRESELIELRLEVASARTRIDSFDRTLRLKVGDAVSAVRSEVQERIAVLESELRQRDRQIKQLRAELARAQRQSTEGGDGLP